MLKKFSPPPLHETFLTHKRILIAEKLIYTQKISNVIDQNVLNLKANCCSNYYKTNVYDINGI